MGIRIDEINALRLGPLGEYNGIFGDINVIYGKNEIGKTFLVEFLIKSLFKNRKGFRFRSNDPSGKVVVTGIDKDPIIFSPKAEKKIEDYLNDDYPGMPTNIARLLVVKGAELGFDPQISQGINKSIIKSFLSGENTLDQVQEKIQKTVQNSYLEDGIIHGDRRGEIKDRLELEELLNEFDVLLERVNNEFSEGVIADLKLKKDKLSDKRDEQIQAKRYLAYQIDNDIKDLEEKMQNANEEELKNLKSNFEEWNRLIHDQKELEEKYQLAAEKGEHYPWLEIALNEYQNFLIKGGVSPKKHLFMSGVGLIALGFLMGFIGGIYSILTNLTIGNFLFYLGMSILLIGLGLGGYYLWQIQRKAEAYAESEEINNIKHVFEEKFKEPLDDIATLKKYEKEYGQIFSQTKIYKDNLHDVDKKLRDLKIAIEQSFQRIDINYDEQNSWGVKIQNAEDQLNEWKNKLQDKKYEFAALNVEEEQFILDEPGITYDRNALKKIEEALEQVEDELTVRQNDLKNLKTEVQTTIKSKSTTDWDDLISSLRQKRAQFADGYRSLTSRIIAGIIVNNIVEDIRAQEDEKIKEHLISPSIKEPLSIITTHYDYLTLEGESVKVGDEFDEFPIDELSTGAKEQVLLAIRLGFATNLIGGKSAFFILDDAFQHSDWNRRELLVNQVTEYAQSGWQIIYFTMDEHIRELFRKIGKPLFNDGYREFVLR